MLLEITLISTPYTKNSEDCWLTSKMFACHTILGRNDSEGI